MSTTGITQNYFYINKTDFSGQFRIFGTLFRPLLLNHLSCRPEILAQNRLRWVFQVMLTAVIAQNYFSI